MGEISDSHPRRASLLARQSLVEAAAEGLLADSAMIAHGRGEAFDYLLGETTSDSAMDAIREVASTQHAAVRPGNAVIRNTGVLAGEELIRVAAVVGCPIEVNLYYRTPERVMGLLGRLSEQRDTVASEAAPGGWEGNWQEVVESVSLLGAAAAHSISGLEGPRAKCCWEGIGQADVVLVPLEDGDRCEALVAVGKQVLVVDLNPLSRTAMTATVTIVDEVSRAASELLGEVVSGDCEPSEWNNAAALNAALEIISDASAEA